MLPLKNAIAKLRQTFLKEEFRIDYCLNSYPSHLLNPE